MGTYFDILPKDLIKMIDEYKKAMNRNNLILYKFWDLFIGKIEYGSNRQIKSYITSLNGTSAQYKLKTRFCAGYFSNGGYFIDIKPDNEEFISDQILVEIINKYTSILHTKDDHQKKTWFNNYCQERDSIIKFN